MERIWPEVNARVNYPIKQILVEMDNDLAVDMNNEIHKNSVSSVACLVAGFGLKRVVLSWNEHPIPGNQLARKKSMYGTCFWTATLVSGHVSIPQFRKTNVSSCTCTQTHRILM